MILVVFSFSICARMRTYVTSMLENKRHDSCGIFFFDLCANAYLSDLNARE